MLVLEREVRALVLGREVRALVKWLQRGGGRCGGQDQLMPGGGDSSVVKSARGPVDDTLLKYSTDIQIYPSVPVI